MSPNEDALRYQLSKATVDGAVMPFPMFVERVGSNKEYIFGSKWPYLYTTFAEEQPGLLDYLTQDEIEPVFRRLVTEHTDDPPSFTYRVVILAMLRSYAEQNHEGDTFLKQAFDMGADTVYGNLETRIFIDPERLLGSNYTWKDFLRWEQYHSVYSEDDHFSLHLGETGRDEDGEDKELVQLCPVQRLGSRLVDIGYGVVSDHVESRFPRQRIIKRIMSKVLTAGKKRLKFPMPNQEDVRQMYEDAGMPYVMVEKYGPAQI